MKKLVLLLGVILVVGGFWAWRQGKIKTPVVEQPREELVIEKEETVGKETPGVKLTIIYDNNLYDPRLEAVWGFSCLIEGLEETILFDTGGDSQTLLSNMEKLGIDPAIVDNVVISHVHFDHIGGLSGFLDKNSNVTVYLPKSLPGGIKDDVKNHRAKLVEVSGPMKIYKGVYSTGELYGPPKEQSLVINSKKGLIVITGCAHPGVVNIVKKAKEMFPDENVYLVLGGFHLTGASDSQLRDIIKDFRELGVQKAAPCHCSGDRCRELFKEAYGEGFIEAGVGKRLEI